jgi:hypothetical protein
MSEEPVDQERPCLHCMIVELIDDFLLSIPERLENDTSEADVVVRWTGPGALALKGVAPALHQHGKSRRCRPSADRLHTEVHKQDAAQLPLRLSAPRLPSIHCPVMAARRGANSTPRGYWTSRAGRARKGSIGSRPGQNRARIASRSVPPCSDVIS